MNAQAKRGRDAAAEADAVALKNAIAAAAAANDAEAQRVKVENELLVNSQFALLLGQGRLRQLVQQHPAQPGRPRQCPQGCQGVAALWRHNAKGLRGHRRLGGGGA